MTHPVFVTQNGREATLINVRGRLKWFLVTSIEKWADVHEAVTK